MGRAALDLAENFPYQPTDLRGSSHLEHAVRSLLYKVRFHNYVHS